MNVLRTAAPRLGAGHRTIGTLSRRPRPLPLRPIKSFIMTPFRSMFIQTQTTPNPDSLKFLPGTSVIPTTDGGITSFEFLNSQQCRQSPLAEKLFSIDGVKSIYFGLDFISINKLEDSNWSVMKPEIYSLLMEWFSTGKPTMTNNASSTTSTGGSDDHSMKILESDSEVVSMIKELLETRVRPTIQEDGGDLDFKSFNEESGVVQLMLKGSCRGCESSSVTLKSGIERMLMHYIPEVKAVEQVLSEEEKVSNDEFAKFEARLRGEGKSVTI